MAIIGITGLAGSGKSEVAGTLVSEHGFIRTAFADPLKDMLLAGGLTRGQTHGALKGEIDDRTGKTPREMMQGLGMFFRDEVHPDFWVGLWEREVEVHLYKGHDIVVEDVRFENEAAAIRALGGQIWRIDRPGVERMGHASENQEIEPDVILANDSGLWDLHEEVSDLIENGCEADGFDG